MNLPVCPRCQEYQADHRAVTCQECGYGPLRILSPAERLDWLLGRREIRVTTRKRVRS